MKIPFLQLHIVTSQTLKKLIMDAKTEGVLEGRKFSEKEIQRLLDGKKMRPIRPLSKRKRK